LDLDKEKHREGKRIVYDGKTSPIPFERVETEGMISLNFRYTGEWRGGEESAYTIQKRWKIQG